MGCGDALCGRCALVIEEVEFLLSELDRPLLHIRLEQELVRGQHPSSACVRWSRVATAHRGRLARARCGGEGEGNLDVANLENLGIWRIWEFGEFRKGRKCAVGRGELTADDT